MPLLPLVGDNSWFKMKKRSSRLLHTLTLTRERASLIWKRKKERKERNNPSNDIEWIPCQTAWLTFRSTFLSMLQVKWRKQRRYWSNLWSVILKQVPAETTTKSSSPQLQQEDDVNGNRNQHGMARHLTLDWFQNDAGLIYISDFSSYFLLLLLLPSLIESATTSICGLGVWQEKRTFAN